MTRSPRGELHHPPQLSARLARALRGMQRLRGWNRVAALLAPRGARGAFTVINEGVLFSGDLGSFIDREVYLSGGYEAAALEAFIRRAPKDRRGLALDIGANVGVHSLALAQHFSMVHAFEPNPALWDQFERNRALNRGDKIVLHRCGLGDQDAELPLYGVDSDNAGLATLLSAPQYDRPLARIGVTPVARGDGVLRRLGAPRVDVVKIDVQGYEAPVLRGLAETLERDRPLTWVEAGGEAPGAITTLAALRALFPYPVEVVHFHGVRRWLTHGWAITPAPQSLPSGDYWVSPAA